MTPEFAVLIVSHDRENTYSARQFSVAVSTIKTSAGVLEIGDGIFMLRLKDAFPAVLSAYSQECRHAEFRLRFTVIPCGSSVFGACPKAGAKELAAFGLDHLETPIPAAQPRG